MKLRNFRCLPGQWAARFAGSLEGLENQVFTPDFRRGESRSRTDDDDDDDDDIHYFGRTILQKRECDDAAVAAAVALMKECANERNRPARRRDR
jgi:hypothetical protein